jgi:hypothetical protein
VILRDELGTLMLDDRETAVNKVRKKRARLKPVVGKT